MVSEVKKSQYKIIIQERDPNKKVSIKDQIIRAANSDTVDATYLFMGFHGRKGPKMEKLLMGSTLKAMSWNTKAPVFIVNSFPISQISE